jgi:pimeloyl-ACP methyl ester carboxylesterase
MNLVYALICFILALVLVLVGATRVGAWLIERRNQPTGQFATVNGTRIHYVHVENPDGADLPALVFIHGASGNLKDQMLPFRPLIEGRAEMLFFDRPGHGWSSRGETNEDPHGQAKTIAALMDHAGIGKAVIVGHSFGSAITATFALDYPQRVAGLVFLAPATHPWPGGATSWYYALTKRPLIGRLFTETLSWPGGTLRMQAATDCVFSPNRPPEDYVGDASIALVLRPRAFRANATDVEGLYRHAVKLAPRYKEILAPTVVISGDRDTVVFEEIHSVGLARDIPNSELVWVRNLGHKPDWIATDLAVAAIEKVSGKATDLQALAKTVEARIATDDFGVGICVDEKPATPAPEMSPAQ